MLQYLIEDCLRRGSALKLAFALLSLGDSTRDFSKSRFPRGDQGKGRRVRPAVLANERSATTEFKFLARLGWVRAYLSLASAGLLDIYVTVYLDHGLPSL